MSKMNYFRVNLLKWWKDNKRHFDWRNPNIDPYQVIVSEILLQRTQAGRVQRCLKDFFSIFPNWHAIRNVRKEHIQNIINPLGLQKQKSNILILLAQKFDSEGVSIPSSRSELESLPGVGPYIASCIMLICYNKKEPLLDTNMARVLSRFFGIKRKSDIRIDKSLQAFAKDFISSNRYKELNWAILDFGALICKSKNPKCLECDINEKCSWANSIL